MLEFYIILKFTFRIFLIKCQGSDKILFGIEVAGKMLVLASKKSDQCGNEFLCVPGLRACASDKNSLTETVNIYSLNVF